MQSELERHIQPDDSLSWNHSKSLEEELGVDSKGNLLKGIEVHRGRKVFWERLNTFIRYVYINLVSLWLM